MGNVVQFKIAPEKPTLEELVERVHRLPQNSDNVDFQHPHVQERMIKRGKGMRDILEVLHKGEGVQGPDLDKYGDYRIKMRRYVCGKRTQVVIAIRQTNLTVVAVI